MYEDLERLTALRDKGAITEEEFQREKKRILDEIENKKSAPDAQQAPIYTGRKKLWGMDERGYCTLLHISQFAGIIIPFAGFVMPIVMWLMGKDDSSMVDQHGRMVINWMISFLIWCAVSGVLVIIGIGLVGLIVLAILNLIFVIKGAIKANDGELYKYPLTINIL